MICLSWVISFRLWRSSRSSARKFHQCERFATAARSSEKCNANQIPLKPVKEIQIPVPWGHIAGKWWGSQDCQPLLGLHGWQDNAGTWDRLAPMLPSHVSLLALDLPGHGFSSHYQSGRTYSLLDYVEVIRRVINHYSWPQVSLLTHSLGSIVSFVFAAVFPDLVHNYVAIDAMKPYSAKIGQPDSAIRTTGKMMDRILDVETCDASRATLYSYQDATDRLVQGTQGSVTPNTACHLLDRGLEEMCEGKFRSRGSPIATARQIIDYTDAGILRLAASIRCNVLHIDALPGHTYDSEEKHKEVAAVVAQSAKKYECRCVEGSHHVHLTRPECVLPIIVQFLHENDKTQ